MKSPSVFRMLTISVLIGSLPTVLVACGSSAPDGNATSTSLSGVVAGDAASTGAVQLRDVSGQKLVSTTDDQQSFQFDVGGLTAPFTLRATLSNGKTVSGVAPGPGVVSVDALSTVAFRGSDDGEEAGDDDKAADSTRQGRFSALLTQLQTVMAPLFSCYGITSTTGPRDPAWRTLFAEVRFDIEDGRVKVTSRQSGAVIFSASLRAISQGTFTAANLPARCAGTPPPAACTSFTYSDWGTCQANGTQQRTVTSATPAGCDRSAAILTQACTPTPTACTSWTYSAWGTCRADGTQTRTATGLPSGCTGTPDQGLTQTCTPASTAALSAVSVTPTSVTGGSSATGTVTLTATAPTGGAVVTLSSSSSAATVPASVTVPAGAATATFAVSTVAVSAAASARITASYGGVSVAATLTVNAPAALTCTSCHGTNGPTTGRHTFHVVSQGFACSNCHGAGYDFAARTVNTATHQDGIVEVTVSNWNATAKTCGGCHSAGSRTW